MFRLRPAKPEDVNFIVHSFLKRYRDAIHIRLVTDKVYYEKQHAVIAKILQTPGCDVRVACDPEDENHIYGWVLAEHLTDDWILLHFCYVKGAFRRFGVAKALLNDVIGTSTKIQYTHKTKLVDFLDPQNRAVFNPMYVWAMA